jgi:hypothetical protein
MLAVGYGNAPVVDLFDGHSLKSLPAPSMEGLSTGGNPNNLSQVIFSGRQNALRGWCGLHRGTWQACSGVGQCGSRRAARSAGRGRFSRSACGVVRRWAHGCHARSPVGGVGVRRQSSLDKPVT